MVDEYYRKNILYKRLNLHYILWYNAFVVVPS